MSERYSVLCGKVDAEMALLQGLGCAYGACAFCDYHLDSDCESAAHKVNERVLARVTGERGGLVVINSGSFFELPPLTIELIRDVVRSKGIRRLHFESHYIYREKIAELRHFFGEGVELIPRVGIETFNEDFRETYLKKGMGFGVEPAEIARYFKECCLLFGVRGQTREDFISDISIALAHFRMVYVNIFVENSTPLKRDAELVEWFARAQLPLLDADPRVITLTDNKDLGVFA
ncbi:MAG: radical SAM protein [Clostridiales bacterium]|jgi:hypothetical protein|nr:radical SAM protein [Clostridiales bacterium]